MTGTRMQTHKLLISGQPFKTAFCSRELVERSIPTRQAGCVQDLVMVAHA